MKNSNRELPILAKITVLENLAAKRRQTENVKAVNLWEDSVDSLISKYSGISVIDEESIKGIKQLWKPYIVKDYTLMHNPNFLGALRDVFIQYSEM